MAGELASEILKDWLQTLGAIFLLVLTAQATRFILEGLRKRGQLPLLTAQSRWISALVIALGLSFALEVAPVGTTAQRWLQGLVYFFTVLIGAGVVRRILIDGIEWGLARSAAFTTLEHGFAPLLRNLATLFVALSGAIILLKHFQFDVMSLITALGVGSLAVGLAAKDTLSNMISGFMLIIDRNLRPGDRINLAGTVGQVDEIGLRSTRIKTGDGNLLIVPNSELSNTRILNLSAPSRETSYSTRIRVPATIPFTQIQATCLEIIAQTEQSLKDRGRWVQLTSLEEGHQLISIGFWISSLDVAGDAASNFHSRLLDRLQKDGIALLSPVPNPSRTAQQI